MLASRDKIVKFSEEYLKVDKFSDYCVNGLQVEGNEKISKIVTGVSISEKLISEAIKRKAEMIIVHHGLFGSSFTPVPKITGYLKKRLSLLMTNNINLCGFHLPLDAHPVIGNNISIAKKLGLKKIKSISISKYGEIGFIGELSSKMDNKKFVDLVDKKLSTKSFSILASLNGVKKVGIVSGGAANDYGEAYSRGADTYITGDIREDSVRIIEEKKVNYINAGHYNSEKEGIKNLGNLINKKFGVKVEFVDIPNEI